MNNKEDIINYLSSLNYNTLKTLAELTAMFSEEQLLKINNRLKSDPLLKNTIIDFIENH